MKTKNEFRVKLAVGYGELQKDKNYPVLEEGRDWYRLGFRGKSIFCPKNLTDIHQDNGRSYEEPEEYEYGYDDE